VEALQRHLIDGARLSLIIGAPAKRSLQRLAAQSKTSQRAVLEQLLEQGEVGEWKRERLITYAPSTVESAAALLMRRTIPLLRKTAPTA
jgi:hypothetical protein